MIELYFHIALRFDAPAFFRGVWSIQEDKIGPENKQKTKITAAVKTSQRAKRIQIQLTAP